MKHEIFDYFKLRRIAEMYNVSLTKAHNWKYDRSKIPVKIRSHMDSLVKFIENRG